MKTSPLTFLTLLLGAAAACAQNPAIPPYDGLQPELAQGVQDGFADGQPKVRHVYLAAPDTLGISIDAQAIPCLPAQKYEPQPGDTIRYERPQNYGTKGSQFFWGRTIIRGGHPIGDVHGADKKFYSPLYKLEGQPLNLTWASLPTSFALSSTDDPQYATAASPLKVFRKTKPEVREYVAGTPRSTYRHDLYLKLPHPLAAGSSYRLHFKNDGAPGSGISFKFDDRRLRTESLHVNLAGYHPNDPEKIALAFLWLGDGGDADLSTLKNFELVEDQSGKVVFSNVLKLTKPASFDPGKGTANRLTDALPMSLTKMDFTAFKEPGVYRVVVPGLGSSFAFPINENVWKKNALISFKGIFNQRSGIELGPPYSTYKRPRNLHPDDGFVVHQTDPAIFYDEKRYGGEKSANPFKRIQASILEGTKVDGAWGGWHDAADYDRSILPQEHTKGVHTLLDLYESNPAYYEKLNLNIPESTNKIPDVIDEALWCLDLFLRIQHADGGVPCAVESIEHPSEPSYLLSQPTVTTPPSPEGCRKYAAAAARMSVDLEKYDSERAKLYRASALRAVAWAEKDASVPNIYQPAAAAAADAVFCQVWLYRLTGDQKWHNQFKDSLPKIDAGSALQSQAAYALLPAKMTEPALAKQCRETVVAAADKLAGQTADLAFNLGPIPDWEYRMGQPENIIAAHRLTRDPKYLLALGRMARFSLGLNPLNASYTVGIGPRQVVPFHLDAYFLGEPFPEGITSWGPLPPNRDPNAKPNPVLDGLYPAWSQWPWAESSYDIRDYRFTEYTVASNMAHMVHMRSYLAQEINN